MPAIKSITEVSPDRGSSVVLSSGGVGTFTNSSYKRSWVVEFDPTDVVSDPNDAVAAVPVGVLGVYQTAGGGVDYTSFCTGVEAKFGGAPWIWAVTASYSSDVDLSNPSGDPLQMPPVFSWGDKTATRPATTYDAAGNKVAQVNSAGDPFDPPITDEETWMTLRITRNVPLGAWNPLVAATYKNAVNNDAWLGFQPGEVLCAGLSADSESQKGTIYWKLTGSFEIKRNGRDSWATQVLDRGFQSFQTVGGVVYKRANNDAAGKPFSSAQLLDGAGKLLARGGTPVYKTFYVKPLATFAAIGLP